MEFLGAQIKEVEGKVDALNTQVEDHAARSWVRFAVDNLTAELRVDYVLSAVFWLLHIDSSTCHN